MSLLTDLALLTRYSLKHTIIIIIIIVVVVLCYLGECRMIKS
jgi:hypothetical protein